MNKVSKRKRTSVTVAEAYVEKRSREECRVQFRAKHLNVLSRSIGLRTYFESQNDIGLLNETRNVLRQNKSKKNVRKVKESWNEKVKRALRGVNKGLPLKMDEVKVFYEKLLEDNSRPESVNHGQSGEAVLFTTEEIKECLKHRAKGNAAGVDRVSKSMLKATLKFRPRFEYIHALLDLFLLNGVPKSFKVALVTLIPKKDQAKDPSQYRPISVTSLVYRLYSRLLSNRFYNAVGNQISVAQGGYRKKLNGCAKNLGVLRSILAEARVERKSLAVASVDLSKAFDSVSHVAVQSCLNKLNMPDYLRNACLDTLDHNVLKFKGGVTVQGKRGVPQGLPLSGYLFIATIDAAVKEMDQLCPYVTANDEKVGALCLVDDLLLFSNSRSELEQKLQALRVKLKEGGWRLNAQKSYAYAQHHRAGKTIIEEGHVDCGDNETIRLIPSSEKFKYLGVAISGSNCLRDNSQPIISNLSATLKRIEHANLSVVEKVKAIREIIIPSQIYRLSNISSVSIWNAKYKETKRAGETQRTNITRLYATMDRMIIRTVKSILRLPSTGVNVSLLYVNESRGGLGLHRLEVLVPIARIRLSDEMQINEGLKDLLNKYHFNDRANCLKLLAKHNLSIENLSREARVKSAIEEAKRGKIGQNLYIPSSKEKVVPLLKKPSGVGFSSYRLQRAIRFRLNCLPTKSRLAIIDPTLSNLCRNGCNKLESLAHLLCERKCKGLEEFWTFRHDQIVRFLFKQFSKFKKTGVKVALELRTGNYQPDLVVFNSDVAIVLEVAVTYGKKDSLKQTFDRKRAKYSTQEFFDQLNAKLNDLIVSDKPRSVGVIPLVFAVQGSQYAIEPCRAMSQLSATMTRKPNAAFNVAAHLAFELSIKYVGKLLNDRALYSNTRVS